MAPRCEQQDGRAQVGASQLGGYGEPVFARKHDIEDDDVVLSCERVIDGFLPVVDEIGVVFVVLEDARERCGKGSIIFCDQYVRGPPRYRLRILGSHGSHCTHGSEKHLKVGRLRTFQVLFRNGFYDAFRCFPTPASREWAEAIPARRIPPQTFPTKRVLRTLTRLHPSNAKCRLGAVGERREARCSVAAKFEKTRRPTSSSVGAFRST